jgi:hypothetical protein
MNANFLLPYSEAWAYSPVALYLCRACISYTFPRLVLKVVMFYWEFAL